MNRQEAPPMDRVRRVRLWFNRQLRTPRYELDVGDAEVSSEEQLAVILRAAPPGVGFSEPRFHNAPFLRIIHVVGDVYGCVEGTILAATDDHQRGAIREATIDLLPRSAVDRYIEMYLERYKPDGTFDRARVLKENWNRLGIIKQMATVKGRMPLSEPFVVSYPYEDSSAWRLVEAFLLFLVADTGFMIAGVDVPYRYRLSTLNISLDDSARLIGMPDDIARRLGKATLPLERLIAR